MITSTTRLTATSPHENNYFGLNPKIGLLYELNDDSQAFINFSRSFQPPSFDNMVTFDDGPGVSLDLHAAPAATRLDD